MSVQHQDGHGQILQERRQSDHPISDGKGGTAIATLSTNVTFYAVGPGANSPATASVNMSLPSAPSGSTVTYSPGAGDYSADSFDLLQTQWFPHALPAPDHSAPCATQLCRVCFDHSARLAGGVRLP